jgi:hypothetical protein
MNRENIVYQRVLRLQLWPLVPPADMLMALVNGHTGPLLRQLSAKALEYSIQTQDSRKSMKQPRMTTSGRGKYAFQTVPILIF